MEVIELSSGASRAVGAVDGGTTHMTEEGLYLHTPFDGFSRVEGGGGWVWFANTRDPYLTGVSVRDTTLRVRVPLPDPRPVTARDRSAWKEFDLTGVSEAIRAQYARHHRTVEFPEVMPRMEYLTLEPDGTVWVQRYAPAWSTEDYTWDVYSTEGVRVAVATLPYALIGPGGRRRTGSEISNPVRGILGDRMVIRATNEWDENIVRVLRIRRGRDRSR